MQPIYERAYTTGQRELIIQITWDALQIVFNYNFIFNNHVSAFIGDKRELYTFINLTRLAFQPIIHRLRNSLPSPLFLSHSLSLFLRLWACTHSKIGSSLSRSLARVASLIAPPPYYFAYDIVSSRSPSPRAIIADGVYTRLSPSLSPFLCVREDACWYHLSFSLSSSLSLFLFYARPWRTFGGSGGRSSRARERTGSKSCCYNREGERERGLTHAISTTHHRREYVLRDLDFSNLRQWH